MTENPYPKPDWRFTSTEGIAIYQGWREGRESLVNDLNEPCTEHEIYADCHDAKLFEGIYPKHKWQCPVCRKEAGLEE